MQFRISKDEFLGALYLAQGIVDRKITLPVLAHILITAEPRQVTILASDQEMSLRRKCGATGVKKGAATANARVLYEIVRSLDEGEIEIRSGEPHGLEVQQGRSRFRIHGVDPAEFPLSEGPDGPSKSVIPIDAEILRRSLELTLLAASTDEVRFALYGVCVERRDNMLRFVASDGHRLSMVSRAVKGVRPDKRVLIPRKAVAEMLKVLDAASGEVQIGFSDRRVTLTVGDVELSTGTIKEEFPSYESVLREDSPLVMTVPAGRWAKALRRVAIVAEERSNGVRMELSEGKLDLFAANREVGEAGEQIDVDYSGQPFKVAFNAKYFLEILHLLPGDAPVELGMLDHETAALMRTSAEPDLLYVVMPMRLD